MPQRQQNRIRAGSVTLESEKKALEALVAPCPFRTSTLPDWKRDNRTWLIA